MKSKKTTIYMILGMHRSATSLTAMLLKSLGIYMGDENEFLPPDKNNPKGYYELRKLVDIDDAILFEKNMTWFSVDSADFEINVSSQGQEMRDILTNLSKNAFDMDCAIKDPRLCILLPVWQQSVDELGMALQNIVIYRDPYEVATSLHNRDQIDFDYALLLWFYYNICILKNICKKKKNTILLLNHNNYYSDAYKQIDKLARFVGREDLNEKACSKIIDTKLRHYNQKRRTLKKTAITEKTEALFQYLNVCSENIEKLTEKGLEPYVKQYQEEYEKLLGKSRLFTAKNIYKMDSHHKKKFVSKTLQTEPKINRLLKLYFESKGINKVSFYGNGTIAQLLIPMLKNIDMEIVYIYDEGFEEATENFKPRVVAEDIKICKHILNTVCYSEQAIEEMIHNANNEFEVISLFEVLYCEIRNLRVQDLKINLQKI